MRKRAEELAADTDAPWTVYLVRCGDGTLYAGIARDVHARFDAHVRGKGARYTRGRGPLALVHTEPAATHGDALRREAAIRRLSRAGKEALIASSGRAVTRASAAKTRRSSGRA